MNRLRNNTLLAKERDSYWAESATGDHCPCLTHSSVFYTSKMRDASIQYPVSRSKRLDLGGYHGLCMNMMLCYGIFLDEKLHTGAVCLTGALLKETISKLKPAEA
jgi:hypothetical protein